MTRDELSIKSPWEMELIARVMAEHHVFALNDAKHKDCALCALMAWAVRAEKSMREIRGFAKMARTEMPSMALSALDTIGETLTPILDSLDADEPQAREP